MYRKCAMPPFTPNRSGCEGRCGGVPEPVRTRERPVRGPVHSPARGGAEARARCPSRQSHSPVCGAQGECAAECRAGRLRGEKPFSRGAFPCAPRLRTTTRLLIWNMKGAVGPGRSGGPTRGRVTGAFPRVRGRRDGRPGGAFPCVGNNQRQSRFRGDGVRRFRVRGARGEKGFRARDRPRACFHGVRGRGPFARNSVFGGVFGSSRRSSSGASRSTTVSLPERFPPSSMSSFHSAKKIVSYES